MGIVNNIVLYNTHIQNTHILCTQHVYGRKCHRFCLNSQKGSQGSDMMLNHKQINQKLNLFSCFFLSKKNPKFEKLIWSALPLDPSFL